MKTLVIAEHDNKQLRAITYNTVAAAADTGLPVHVLVAGHSADAVAEAASHIRGVEKVLSVDAEHFSAALAENIAAQIASLASAYTHIFFSATASGRSVAPRVAAQLDVAPISDIVSVEATDTFKRPIYAGSAIATVQSADRIIVATVRPTAFAAASTTLEGSPIEKIEAVSDRGLSRFVRRELVTSDRPDLTSAKVVVSGGRGLGSAENFLVLDPLAKRLGAAIGASRAAVDSGFAPNDAQVGQTGKIVAPDLYIAFGISGAIQHLAGMKDSKIIVAVNKDPEAPIFGVADYGVVGDLFDVIPAITSAL